MSVYINAGPKHVGLNEGGPARAAAGSLAMNHGTKRLYNADVSPAFFLFCLFSLFFIGAPIHIAVCSLSAGYWRSFLNNLD